MGRFRILERVGSGGMGTVFRAFDERLQREVAVKEIEHAGAARVMREAQAAARLNHPAIVTLYELGERRGRALLVSEFVHGATLGALARTGELSDRDVGEVGIDLCDGLDHAHRHGVVHRDVKPHNAMVRPAGSSGRRAKLMDFGIASVAGADALTAAGEVIGTLAYMAPEQADGEPVGPAADVYALALTLYEAWTGENPVAGRTPAETARRIGEPLPPLAELRPDLPEELAARIDACLDPDPHARPFLLELRATLARALPELDDEHTVPAQDEREDEPRLAFRSAARLLGWIAAAVALATLAGPAGLAGIALVAAAVILPPLCVGAGGLRCLLPAAAIPLGAAGAFAVLPAALALAGRTALERLMLGASGFVAYVIGALAFGAGARLGIAPRAQAGWPESGTAAARDLLAPLADPTAALGLAVCATAALTLGAILRLHPALALVGAMIWAAAVGAGLAALGNGGLARHAFVPVLAAGAAVAAEAWRRSRYAPAQPAPIAAAPRVLQPERPHALA